MLKETFQAPKGMPDILPNQSKVWEKIFSIARELGNLYDFSYIETPIVEKASLFEAGLEKTSDIVEKQMFFLKTEGKDRLVLRPEGTAPIVRSYLEHHLGYYSHPLKVFYFGPFFRYEKPQFARFRQFHQCGFEILGSNTSLYDVLVILITLRFLDLLKIQKYHFQINSLGCPVCRPNYKRKLLAYYQPLQKKLCPDCRKRLKQNPFRLFDCQNENCRALKSSAPIMLDYFCKNCNNHFQGVLDGLENNKIFYEIDFHLSRGLDYYNRTVFEVSIPEFKPVLAAGGRYDYLAKALGAQELGAVGSALGIERIIEAIKIQKISLEEEKEKKRIFLAVIGSEAEKNSFLLIERLTAAGFSICENIGRKSLKAQLKAANKRKIFSVLIIGQKEVFEETIILKDMESGIQEVIPQDKLINELKKRIH